MVEEAAASASEIVQQTLTDPVTQTLEEEPNQASIEATIESSVQGGATDSTCNNNAAESAVTEANDEEPEKTLEFADELTEKGKGFLKENEFADAVDCFSRALEIKVEHYGELAVECVNAYYRYGSALLEKAQAEGDPLGSMAKKEGEVQQESSNKNAVNGEAASAASVVSTNPERQGSSSGQEGAGAKDQEEDGEDCQGEDDDVSDADADADADEDESDLDTAWKMLDIARAITDKHSSETKEKVDILCALAEVSLEREDIESSLSDYKQALSILERVVEPDNRYIAELNFRICVCLETGCQAQEAIPYCQKAILICKARMERLSNEIKGSSTSATSSTVSGISEGIQQSSNVPYIDDKSASDKEAEIGVLSGLAEDLEKKLEDLKQQAENPRQVLAELMGIASGNKTNATDKGVAATAAAISSSRMATMNTAKDLESPTVSTAHTGAGASSGVTNLGVVGRGVKRVLLNTTSAESNPSKKPTPEPSDKADGNP